MAKLILQDRSALELISGWRRRACVGVRCEVKASLLPSSLPEDLKSDDKRSPRKWFMCSRLQKHTAPSNRMMRKRFCLWPKYTNSISHHHHHQPPGRCYGAVTGWRNDALSQDVKEKPPTSPSSSSSHWVVGPLRFPSFYYFLCALTLSHRVLQYTHSLQRRARFKWPNESAPRHNRVLDYAPTKAGASFFSHSSKAPPQLFLMSFHQSKPPESGPRHCQYHWFCRALKMQSGFYPLPSESLLGHYHFSHQLNYFLALRQKKINISNKGSPLVSIYLSAK